MKKSIYLCESNTWKLIPKHVKNQIDTVVTGHYGCQKAAHYSMQQVREIANEFGLSLYYISPKVSNDIINLEEEYIVKLLESGTKVSVNDWGLFYRLRKHGVSFDSIYLGRLLSKSIADWVWSDIFFQKENRNAVNYLSQINLYDIEKMEWLKSFHIAGVEVSIHRSSEKSYEEIQKNGLKIIGFVDTELVTLSRACLFKKLDEQSNAVCSGQCHNEVKAIKKEGQQLMLNVAGNLLTKYNKKTIQWAGYDCLVYDGLSMVENIEI